MATDSLSDAPVPLQGVDATHWRQQRLKSQAAVDRQASIAIGVIYQVDALLLAGWCLAGAGRWSSPLAFSLCGLLVLAGSLLAHRRDATIGLDNPRRVLLQAAAAIALVLGVAWSDPPLAVPMLLTLVGVVAASALRMAPRWLLGVSAVTAIVATTVVVAQGGRLSLPTEGLAQQLLTGAFLFWTLAKAAGIHMAGMAMRLEIDASHARLAEALERVRLLAEVDELTGVANRRRVLAALEEERARCVRQGNGFAVAMLDIDHFKRINDGHGHPVGDQVLQAAAQALRGALRLSDTVGRFGGEEFLLVLPGADTPDAALQAGERLRQAIAGHAWGAVVDGLEVTASVGVVNSVPGEPVARLIERADRGLYEAKRRGRNRVVAWPGPVTQ